MTCNLLAERRHVRQRHHDIEWLWVQLVAYGDSDAEVSETWARFVAAPENVHWRCPCAEEIAATFRAVNFRVQAFMEDQ